ncbi:helix-turn-helix transcriptional regulator [Plantactinospora sp. KBS50]|uniref:ArsR/SmtB family transcription factor n=1 Tax=Plantactinospora sp. KBS50 TaxID=2024580 RepID=UPI001E405224|nr:metalloregulator ArsR/SmtB family transcription factor [Plantactinospora sp. KBS50]
MIHPSLDAVGPAAFFGALGDPVRLEIIRQLAVDGCAVCSDFRVEVSMSTLSHHLRILRAAGLIRVSRDGRYRRHELRRAEVEARFPGLLESVIAAVDPPARTSETPRVPHRGRTRGRSGTGAR